MSPTLGAWLHTLDPFVVRISDGFGVRWYGVAYLAGFVIAYVLLRWLASRGLTPIPRERVADAMLWFIAGVLVGGRAGYLLVYQPSLLWELLPSPPWWGALAINQGGMASHGGMAGVILAAWRVSRGWRDDDGQVRGRCSPLHVCDLAALVAPAGLLLGRLANFVNGELLGRIVAPPGVEGPWWSVQFPQELRGWVAPGVREGHAPPLTEAQEQQLLALVERVRHAGDSFPQAVDRLIDRAAQYAAQLKPLLASRHPSQIYQALAEGVVVGAVVWLAAARARKPGVVGGWFLVAYGALRIATETIRLPDPQFGAGGRPAGLSRGQWLSVAMVAAGVAVLATCSRRAAPRLLGWARRPAPPAQ
jgi:phosphatidylglycerol:prolipoprotein diacylglycerol transferase